MFFREPVDAANRQTAREESHLEAALSKMPAVGGAGSARYRQENLESGYAGK